MRFKQWIENSEHTILESKQDIANLGYPMIVAKLFYKKFGKYAHLFARWYRDYRTNDPTDNWFNWVHQNFRTTSLPDLIELHQATDSPENYMKTLEKLDLSIDDNENVYDDTYLQEQRKALEEQIEDKMFSDGFFSYYSLINDFLSNKITNIAPYKDLSFFEAQQKYDKKTIFQDQKPLKTYNNGFRWIDAGKRCTLLGGLMKNCGSAGVMSFDQDRTMIALFDSENKPHVVVTYSPNEKRISGDEGIAGTEVKSKYHRYILDLSKFLGATFDFQKSKSRSLGTKYQLQGKVSGFRKLPGKDLYNDYFTFMYGQQPYYSNSYVAVSKQDADKVQQALKSGQLILRNKQRSVVRMIFNNYNQDDLKQFGIQYTPISQFGVSNSPTHVTTQ